MNGPQLATLINQRIDEVLEAIANLRTVTAVHDHRIGTLEKQADKWADATGKHQAAALAELKASRRYWLRWAVGILAALVLSAGGAGLGILLG
jgi:hypothetical protein